MVKEVPAPTTNDANRTYRKMTEEAVAPLVLKLGVPTMLSMLVTALYMTASTYYVSYLGTSAVGAMGVIFALQTIIQAIGIMIGQGCAAQTSRLLGAKAYVHANTLASSGLFISLLFSSLFALTAWAVLEWLLSWMGATATILPYASTYAQIILLACPFMAASYTLNNLLRSEGLAIVGMMGLGAGGVLNIGVAPIFIFVFDWGIAGAAWANALCQIISFTILLSHYLRGKGSLQIHCSFISKEATIYFSIFKNGLPSLTRNSLGAVNWGAKLFDRVKTALDVTIAMGTVLMVALGLLGFIFAQEVVGFFKVNDPNVMNVGVLALRLQCSVAIIVPVNVIGNMAFQVIGRTAVGTLLAATRQGLFFLPLILILPGQIGLLGVQSAQPIAEVLSFFVCGYFLWHFRTEVQNRIKIQKGGELNSR